jgi:hypothetical protein
MVSVGWLGWDRRQTRHYETQMEKHTLYIQLLSGDVIPLSHPAHQGLFYIKCALARMNPEWETPLQVLYRQDEKGDYSVCKNPFSSKEGERLYLVIREPIRNEGLQFIYPFDHMELYRFYHSLQSNSVEFTFTVKENTAFSMDYPYWKKERSVEKTTWFFSVEEMLRHYSETVCESPLEEDSIQNMIYLWETRYGQ